MELQAGCQECNNLGCSPDPKESSKDLEHCSRALRVDPDVFGFSLCFQRCGNTSEQPGVQEGTGRRVLLTAWRLGAQSLSYLDFVLATGKFPRTLGMMQREA